MRLVTSPPARCCMYHCSLQSVKRGDSLSVRSARGGRQHVPEIAEQSVPPIQNSGGNVPPEMIFLASFLAMFPIVLYSAFHFLTCNYSNFYAFDTSTRIVTLLGWQRGEWITVVSKIPNARRYQLFQPASNLKCISWFGICHGIKSFIASSQHMRFHDV